MTSQQWMTLLFWVNLFYPGQLYRQTGDGPIFSSLSQLGYVLVFSKEHIFVQVLYVAPLFTEMRN